MYEGVFGTYITGFLEGEDTLEDKTEALDGILSEVMKDDILTHCGKILDKWKKVSQTADILTEIMQALVKIWILNWFNFLSLSHDQPLCSEHKQRRSEGYVKPYGQNMLRCVIKKMIMTRIVQMKARRMVSSRIQLQLYTSKLKRKTEKATSECQKKKDKDKHDREKQKQLQQERKEKCKTQKGERRR